MATLIKEGAPRIFTPTASSPPDISKSTLKHIAPRTKETHGNPNQAQMLSRLSTLPSHGLGGILRGIERDEYVPLEEISARTGLKPARILKQTLPLDDIFHVVQSEEGDISIGCPPLLGSEVTIFRNPVPNVDQTREIELPLTLVGFVKNLFSRGRRWITGALPAS